MRSLKKKGMNEEVNFDHWLKINEEFDIIKANLDVVLNSADNVLDNFSNMKLVAVKDIQQFRERVFKLVAEIIEIKSFMVYIIGKFPESKLQKIQDDVREKKSFLEKMMHEIQKRQSPNISIQSMPQMLENKEEAKSKDKKDSESKKDSMNSEFNAKAMENITNYLNNFFKRD